MIRVVHVLQGGVVVRQSPATTQIAACWCEPREHARLADITKLNTKQ